MRKSLLCLDPGFDPSVLILFLIEKKQLKRQCKLHVSPCMCEVRYLSLSCSDSSIYISVCRSAVRLLLKIHVSRGALFALRDLFSIHIRSV